MLKSHRSLCMDFSRTGAGLCIYHFLVWSNLNFLHISQWITWPNQSCLASYSRCTNLLHSLIKWLMVSSLSTHSLHLLFCWVLSNLALIWLVLMALNIIIIIILLFWQFSLRHLLMVSHRRFSDNKSPKVWRTLVSILVDTHNAVVRIVSVCTLISNSFSHFINPLGIAPRGHCTIGITDTFMFLSVSVI